MLFNNFCDEINNYFASNFSVDRYVSRLLPPNENGFWFVTTNQYEIDEMKPRMLLD